MGETETNTRCRAIRGGAAPTSPGTTLSGKDPTHRESAPGIVVHFFDPEWPLFALFLLLPAGCCLLLGHADKAELFAGLAIYLCVLKWLGWLVFTAHNPRAPAFALFAAEIAVGLTAACAWFYARNLAGGLWPSGYSLWEFSLLPWAVVAIHLAVGVVRLVSVGTAAFERSRVWRTALAQRAGVYVPFVVLLTVSLWAVSDSLGVQGSDANHFAFCTRVYVHDGFLARHFNGEHPIVYPTGFGAINAVAVAVAPMSAVQAVNVQHVVLLVTGLFLVTGTLSVLVGRPLWCLHVLPLVFTAVFPLYCLFPFIGYQGPGRQAAPAFLATICVLPVLARFTRFGHLALLTGVVALLAALTVALNPACVPFAALACLLALVLTCAKARTELGSHWLKVLGLQAGMFGAAALLFLAGDPYYSGLLATHSMSGIDDPTNSASSEIAEPGFSWTRAVAALPALDLFGLTPERLTFPIYTRLTKFQGWQGKPPHSWFPILGLGLGLAFLALLAVRRDVRRVAGVQSMATVVWVSSILWFVLKTSMMGLAEGLSPAHDATALLASYIRLLLLRCELLLLFTYGLAAGTGLFLCGEYLARTTAGWRVSRVAAASVFSWLPYVFLGSFASLNGFVVSLTTNWARITPDDLRLVAWIDAHLPPEKGLIGLAGRTLRLGGHDEEHHIYPVHGAQALQLYGRNDNFCFTMNDPGRYFGPEAYNENVRDRLHVAWCLRHGIRYFYVPEADLDLNPGLTDAIADGRLQPLKRFGSSCVYEVRGEEGTEARP